MQLSEYMTINGLGASALARKLGVSHSAVIRWRDRVRHPQPAMMRRIAVETGGAVTANDFMELPAPSEGGAA